uniref:Uncharacterized protein n=1 Tax=Anopheles arabiensis TaxID=7173 RepID=A0A182IH23_ANOAR
MQMLRSVYHRPPPIFMLNIFPAVAALWNDNSAPVCL